MAIKTTALGTGASRKKNNDTDEIAETNDNDFEEEGKNANEQTRRDNNFEDTDDNYIDNDIEGKNKNNHDQVENEMEQAEPRGEGSTGLEAFLRKRGRWEDNNETSGVEANEKLRMRKAENHKMPYIKYSNRDTSLTTVYVCDYRKKATVETTMVCADAGKRLNNKRYNNNQSFDREIGKSKKRAGIDNLAVPDHRIGKSKKLAGKDDDQVLEGARKNQQDRCGVG